MWNRIRIESQLPNLFPGLSVVGVVDGVRQQEFRFALRSVSFDGDDHGGTNENAAFRFLGDYYAALFNAKALAQLRWYYNRAAFSNSCRLHGQNSSLNV